MIGIFGPSRVLLFHFVWLKKKKRNTENLFCCGSYFPTCTTFSLRKQTGGSCQNLHLKPQNVIFAALVNWLKGKKMYLCWCGVRPWQRPSALSNNRCGKEKISPWKPTPLWSITDAGDQPCTSFKLGLKRGSIHVLMVHCQALVVVLGDWGTYLSSQQCYNTVLSLVLSSDPTKLVVQAWTKTPSVFLSP